MPTDTRRYSSELREQQAAQTRRRIVEAAVVRFAENGYERTTLAEIASEAKVSVETVRAHGPKAALVVAAVECVTYNHELQPFIESELGQGYVAQPDPESFLDHAVGVSLEINKLSYGAFAALASAAAGDPELDRALTERLALAREEIDQLVGICLDRGWARTDLSRDELVTTVWVLVMPETYERLVVRAGFSETRYLAWLRRTLAEAVLPRS
ncbi:TetR/AcrR family transcriptional regulator [Protaetiibacter intestinalis]|uniref:TetR/AcrR family transcriptional regulator n=1 Tax=Protaetiibacter intestinalis TaxID=2419774 RepID=A0A387B527_9MICO|nr:TetR/AcrR family transcriptional regulator [Protaetiibacter intestinalis]AYF96848.1 TetR/AcrR family transcriptional regulator [Protaetiibacter intestinalis]